MPVCHPPYSLLIASFSIAHKITKKLLRLSVSGLSNMPSLSSIPRSLVMKTYVGQSLDWYINTAWLRAEVTLFLSWLQCSRRLVSQLYLYFLPCLNLLKLIISCFMWLPRWKLLTRSPAEVRVEPLWLQHDEQRSPAQQHGREQQVFHNCRHCHPPAPGKSCGQGGSHLCWITCSNTPAWREGWQLKRRE